jgi:hypothetical protein
VSECPVSSVSIQAIQLSSPSSVSVCCFYTPVVPASQFVRLHCPSADPLSRLSLSGSLARVN